MKLQSRSVISPTPAAVLRHLTDVRALVDSLPGGELRSSKSGQPTVRLTVVAPDGERKFQGALGIRHVDESDRVAEFTYDGDDGTSARVTLTVSTHPDGSRIDVSSELEGAFDKAAWQLHERLIRQTAKNVEAALVGSELLARVGDSSHPGPVVMSRRWRSRLVVIAVALVAALAIAALRRTTR